MSEWSKVISDWVAWERNYDYSPKDWLSTQQGKMLSIHWNQWGLSTPEEYSAHLGNRLDRTHNNKTGAATQRNVLTEVEDKLKGSSQGETIFRQQE